MNNAKKIWGCGAFAAVIAAIISFSLIPPPKSARAQLNAVQTWAGTAGGTSTALTLTIHNVVSLNDLLGVPIRFLPSGVPIGPTTLTVNLDSGGTLDPTAILRPTSNMGLQQLGSDMTTGQMAEVTYDGTEFVITSSIDMTAIGDTVNVRGSAAPQGTLIEDGSCYSRTTYPTLFADIGTTYNSTAPVSCSGSQFAVPFSNGQSFVAFDAQGANGAANRITTATCAAPNTAGGTCGLQAKAIVSSNVPSITLSVSTSFSNVPTTAGVWNNSTNVSTAGSSGDYPQGTAAVGNLNNLTSTGTAGNVSPTAFATLPPISLGIRAIKF